MAKYIFITGGVVSSLGKGIASASIGKLLEARGLKGANSTEFAPKTKHPVISLLEEQKGVKAMGGTMRLGAYRCDLKKGTKSLKAYKRGMVMERHRHRYEFNNRYLKALEKKGLVVSGTHKPGDLAEIIELKEHPWFVACQFHPEFQSKPDRAHPLFRDFVKAALEARRAKLKD